MINFSRFTCPSVCPLLQGNATAARTAAKSVRRLRTKLPSRLASAEQSQALSALLFLYRHVLRQDLGELSSIVRARRKRRLPVVLTHEEVEAVLSHLRGRYRLMAGLLYGSGLRLRECLSLRVKDLDFGHHQIVVRSGKGDKDRVTMMPEMLREPLERHLRRVRVLFEGAGTGKSAASNAGLDW